MGWGRQRDQFASGEVSRAFLLKGGQREREEEGVKEEGKEGTGCFFRRDTKREEGGRKRGRQRLPLQGERTERKEEEEGVKRERERGEKMEK